MLDYDLVKSYGPLRTEQAWTRKDTILYALGVGASELDFVFEEGLRALPTMPCVLGYPGFVLRDPALGLDWTRIVHGEQEVTLHRPLPVEGAIVGETRIEAISDKGAEKGAVIYQTRDILDGEAQLIATCRMATFARGDGGFDPAGGDPAPMEPVRLPDGPPDLSVSLPTQLGQALIYRLSGDYNPLHIDPKIAHAAGFDRPILHGMCTFGVSGRALVAAVCGNDPSRVRSMRCRFSAPVYPGDTIRTEVWRASPGVAYFRAVAEEREAAVLGNGKFTYLEGGT